MRKAWNQLSYRKHQNLQIQRGMDSRNMLGPGDYYNYSYIYLSTYSFIYYLFIYF